MYQIFIFGSVQLFSTAFLWTILANSSFGFFKMFFVKVSSDIAGDKFENDQLYQRHNITTWFSYNENYSKSKVIDVFSFAKNWKSMCFVSSVIHEDESESCQYFPEAKRKDLFSSSNNFYLETTKLDVCFMRKKLKISYIKKSVNFYSCILEDKSEVEQYILTATQSCFIVLRTTFLFG